MVRANRSSANTPRPPYYAVIFKSRRTKGDDSIVSDNKPARFGRKTPRKPLELPALMIALGGIRASE